MSKINLFFFWFEAQEEFSKQAQAMKVILFGDQEHEPVQDQIQLFATDVFSSGLISKLILNLPNFEFEVKKIQILCYF